MFQMHNFGAQSFRLAIAMMAVGISTSPAHAYLDPGTGSIILQILLGGIAGIAVTVKLYWHKLLSLSGLGRQAQESNQLPASGAARRSVGEDERSRQ
jgi:hypothetical protein